jgi:hypothetical protein
MTCVCRPRIQGWVTGALRFTALLIELTPVRCRMMVCRPRDGFRPSGSRGRIWPVLYGPSKQRCVLTGLAWIQRANNHPR